MVVYRINETLQTGAVTNRTYRAGETVYLFLKFTIVHFLYSDDSDIYHLKEVKITVIPNGKLQDRYNPTVDDGIWLAGRNAPTLGEDFRVRVSFARIQQKASWRVQTIHYDEINGECRGQWHP